ncbi:TetR/AcrR family transcriptional regulator [Actinacidiphila acididurans]|uniref:TetR/AcrR family transcriptional regulator n=1 Tax=Actinacidiphila acididurans TaxID=2784346 RepID=A0ABS2TS50_9ACTN|nr:TetR/AcrR family transcriptional regulator [Actinacidiphila acididurans]MBM9506151.1 TetR/AcrR family transcriptional regulator [Actinacidiphila acididurans]
MTPEPSAATNASYHQRVKEEKRAAILTAGTRLFLECGYDRTSLAQVAKQAGVSTATLFKRFPTKSALFEAIVSQYWQLESQWDYLPEPGDPKAGLTKIGRDYACLLTRPGMAALFRIVIAESSRFPELGRMQGDLGRQVFLSGLHGYFAAEHDAGTLHIPDPDLAAGQFLGMIADQIFWPRLLLVDFDMDEPAMYHVVDEAVLTMLARYRPEPSLRS